MDMKCLIFLQLLSEKRVALEMCGETCVGTPEQCLLFVQNLKIKIKYIDRFD